MQNLYKFPVIETEFGIGYLLRRNREQEAGDGGNGLTTFEMIVLLW